jgi:hypothetical protein
MAGLGGPKRTGAMAEKRTSGGADGDSPDIPFLSWADQPFEPVPEDAGLSEAARIARALEYIAYQLYHVREVLGELAAAEPRSGPRRPGAALGRRAQPAPSRPLPV